MPQLQAHPHPTPALNRNSSIQVTSVTSSQSRSATQGGFLCGSAGDADPGCWGAHGGPRGARQVAPSTPQDTQVSAPAGGTWVCAKGGGRSSPNQVAGCSPDRVYLGFRVLVEGSHRSTGVSEDTQQRARRQSAQFRGCPAPPRSWKSVSLPSERTRVSLAHQEASGPEAQG